MRFFPVDKLSKGFQYHCGKVGDDQVVSLVFFAVTFFRSETMVSARTIAALIKSIYTSVIGGSLLKKQFKPVAKSRSVNRLIDPYHAVQVEIKKFVLFPKHKSLFPKTSIPLSRHFTTPWRDLREDLRHPTKATKSHQTSPLLLVMRNLHLRYHRRNSCHRTKRIASQPLQKRSPMVRNARVMPPRPELLQTPISEEE